MQLLNLDEHIKRNSVFVELDALGDEIALDEDTSYLDEAVKTPTVPSKEPGADSLPAGVIVISFCNYFVQLSE